MKENAIQVREIGGITVISPQLDFTMSVEKIMEDIYHDLCEKGCTSILFEFLPNTHITSGGMAILFSLIRESQKKNQEIGITGLSKHFEKTFQMVGITRYTKIYQSTEEALQEMSRAPL
ncbi:MAG: STAS domain-containing protein [bacterium]